LERKTLALFECPPAHWKRLRTTNVIEQFFCGNVFNRMNRRRIGYCFRLLHTERYQLASLAANCSFKSMFRSLLLAASLALICGCASNPEPMRTGIAPNPRYSPPEPTSPAANPSNPATVGESVWASDAAKWIGAPYRAGGNTREGMDTLGLIRRMYDNVARIHLTTGLEELARTGTAIPRDQLRPGDIVFFGKPTITDAGVFLGEGRFIESLPTFGVVYASLADQHTSERYNTARRILR
jgi:lipoprotein Spr